MSYRDLELPNTSLPRLIGPLMGPLGPLRGPLGTIRPY